MATQPLLVALLAGLLLAGCVEQAGVSNQKDNFSYGGQMANRTATDAYTWDNSQAKAQVHWGGQASSGMFTLTIKDATGKQVYHRSIQGATQSGSSETSATGTPGAWTVELRFEDFTGQMGLNIQAQFAAQADYCPPSVPGC